MKKHYLGGHLKQSYFQDLKETNDKLKEPVERIQKDSKISKKKTSLVDGRKHEPIVTEVPEKLEVGWTLVYVEPQVKKLRKVVHHLSLGGLAVDENQILGMLIQLSLKKIASKSKPHMKNIQKHELEKNNGRQNFCFKRKRNLGQSFDAYRC